MTPLGLSDGADPRSSLESVERSVGYDYRTFAGRCARCLERMRQVRRMRSGSALASAIELSCLFFLIHCTDGTSRLSSQSPGVAIALVLTNARRLYKGRRSQRFRDDLTGTAEHLDSMYGAAAAVQLVFG